MRDFDLLFVCFVSFVFEYIQDCVVGVCVCVFWTVGWMVGCTGISLFISPLLYFSSTGLLDYSLVVFQV